MDDITPALNANVPPPTITEKPQSYVAMQAMAKAFYDADIQDGTVSVMSTATPNLDPGAFRNLKHIGSVWAYPGSGVHSLGAYQYFQAPGQTPDDPPKDVATGFGMYSSNDDGSEYAEIVATPGRISISADTALLKNVKVWGHSSILTLGKADELYATAKIPDFKANHTYAIGDTVYYEGHIWRALKHGNLVAPDKPQGTAIVYFNATGYSKNPYRITSVTNAAPVGLPHTPFDMHLEYVSDLNFHLYKPNGPVWEKITGITIKTWFSEGVPAIPYPNHATIWIYSAPGTHPAPIAGQNDWTSLKFNEFLSGLSDVDFEDQPRGGQSLVYNDAMHRWINGTPAFKLPDHLTTVHYQHGDTVYYQGQFWRNILTTTTNFNNIPHMTPNGAVGFFRHGGIVIGPIMAESVEIGDPAVAPTGHVDKPLGKHYALKWQDDEHWSAWEWAIISHGPTTWGWKQITLAHHKTWRNFALPAPVTEEDTGQLWIYAAPGTTTPPVVPQKNWEPVPLGDFLVSLSDVDAINAKANDTLVYNGQGKWVAQAPTGGGGGGNTTNSGGDKQIPVDTSAFNINADLALGNYIGPILLNKNYSFVWNNVPSLPEVKEITVVFEGTGTAYNVTWNMQSAVRWQGVPPTVTSTAGKRDVFKLFFADGDNQMGTYTIYARRILSGV